MKRLIIPLKRKDVAKHPRARLVARRKEHGELTFDLQISAKGFWKTIEEGIDKKAASRRFGLKIK